MIFLSIVESRLAGELKQEPNASVEKAEKVRIVPDFTICDLMAS